MNTIEDYIIVENTIPKEICKNLIDENIKKEWKKHTWNNYAAGTFESEPTKELDVMPCTKEQQEKITPYLIEALGRYQIKVCVPGEKTEDAFLTKFIVSLLFLGKKDLILVNNDINFLASISL